MTLPKKKKEGGREKRERKWGKRVERKNRNSFFFTKKMSLNTQRQKGGPTLQPLCNYQSLKYLASSLHPPELRCGHVTSSGQENGSRHTIWAEAQASPLSIFLNQNDWYCSRHWLPHRPPRPSTALQWACRVNESLRYVCHCSIT